MATNAKIVLSVLVVGLVVGAGAAAALGGVVDGERIDERPADLKGEAEPSVADGLATFESTSEYHEYVRRGAGGYDLARVQVGGNVAAQFDVSADVALESTADGATVAQATASGGDGGASDEPARIGGTNVQERNIDEPDLVATVGHHFVYAPRGDGRPHLPWRDGEGSPVDRERSAHVVDASDPVDPALVAEIDATGRMVRSGDSLVVLGDRSVTGYDVSDPENPSKTWSKELDSAIETARMNDGQLYVVTRTNARQPCPIQPMESTEIACTDVHRPEVRIDADATFTAFSIDPASGDVADSTSFVGTARSTVVYMSEDALYVTYTERTDRAELRADFLVEEADVVPADVKDRLAEIDGYDISAQAKGMEMRRAVDGWLESLSEGERIGAREALRIGLENYAAERQRNLTETGIVRVDVGDGDLSVDATGSVPGEPLDQFSMDEHEGTLRIATTIPRVHDVESENDLYTLDAERLDRLGAETGMGVDERIYSVRYVDDTAYMVTFRQIDPFHVVDLSDPSEPEELGNVELPGFSEYLHPVGNDTIMGVGEEDGRVKAVLFDVSDPANPTVADSKLLDARWSAVSRTHHAFMHDPRHGIAFLPTGEQGVVLDYTDGTLAVEKRIQLDGAPERARYVDDYLYVFSPAEIQVVDETTWTEEASLALAD